MKKAIVFLFAALASCGGGIPNVTLLQSANIGAALAKFIATPATYDFSTPTTPAVTASIAVASGNNVTFTVNGTQVAIGTLGVSATGDYVGANVLSGTITETVVPQTSAINITTVGQHGNLYTSTWTSAGATMATEVVTYSVNELSLTLLNFCEDITITADANPYNFVSGAGQICFAIDATNTVKDIELQLPFNGSAVPFIQTN